MKALLVSENVWMTSKLQTVLKVSAQLRDCMHVQTASSIKDELKDDAVFDIIFLVLNEDIDQAKFELSYVKLGLNCCVVAVGAVRSSEEVIDLLHCGADDFLDTQRDLESQVKNILKSAKVRFGVNDSPQNDIAFIGASGGVGTSSLATNVAASLTSKQQETGIVDLVFGQGDVARLVGLKPVHTIQELCENASDVDSNLLERSIVKHSSGLSLLAAGDFLLEENEVVRKKLSRVEVLACELFNNTVFDLGGAAQYRKHTSLLQQVRTIVLTFRLDFPSICNARQVLDRFDSNGIDHSKVILVANRHRMPIQIPIDKAEIILGRKIGYKVPNDPELMNLTVNCGVPAITESPKSRYSQAVNLLVEDLMQRADSSSPEKTKPSKEGPKGITEKSLQFLKQSVGCFNF